MNRKAMRMAVLLAVFFPACPAALYARGGGGCLEQDTLIDTPAGPVKIQDLSAGMKVRSFISGRPHDAAVIAAVQVQPDSYVELTLPGGAAVRLTAEHPVAVGQDEFIHAGLLKTGDLVVVSDGSQGLKLVALAAVRRVSTGRPAYNLLVAPGGTFLAGLLLVHNKGCFLPDTPIIRSDGSSTLINAIQPGDSVLAFAPDGKIVSTTVRRVFTHQADGFLIVRTADVELHVTEEHPFFMGHGKYKVASAIKEGDEIFAWDGQKSLTSQKVLQVTPVSRQCTVYNLQTDDPHTFFAAGIAVHNKGGGGCFLPDTPILRADGSTVQISSIRPGDRLLAFRPDGSTVQTTVRDVMVRRAEDYFVLKTRNAQLHVTGEHPFYAGGGLFRACKTLKPGGAIYAWNGRGGLEEQKIESIARLAGETFVFNLMTDDPHTFFASGIAVHNKGGGSSSHSSGSRGSGGSGSGLSGPFDLIVFVIFVSIFIAFFLLVIFKSKSAKTDEDLDYCHSRSEIERKSGKTAKLLEFISRTDLAWAPQQLADHARNVFLKLQECWQARDYGPMAKLMMAHLHAEHCKQLDGMRRNHEINKMENLAVKAVDIVHIRYTSKSNDRQFTALITASARDYYVDDRTGKEIRGDDKPATFQEFWTFHWQDGVFLLGEIEQTRESDALKDEDFFEQFTDQQVESVTGQAVDKTGPAGPWLEKESLTKATRIERMLNFLAETDKLWTRQAMLDRAGDVFTRFYMAREAGAFGADLLADCFPQIAEFLRQESETWKFKGMAFEYRNFCVRKVELILVRNFRDNSRDEFVARISAHAQRVCKSAGQVEQQDEYVTPFEEFWTFGRLDNAWKLKEIVPATRGRKSVAKENIDEDSTKHQLKWYYSKKRTV